MIILREKQSYVESRYKSKGWWLFFKSKNKSYLKVDQKLLKILWDFLIYLSSRSNPNLASLEPPDLDSGFLFDLLIFNFRLLLRLFDLLFYYLHPLTYDIRINTLNYIGSIKQYNFLAVTNSKNLSQAIFSLLVAFNGYTKITPINTSIDWAKMISASFIICIWLNNCA